jgi:hypothetical protein
MMTHELSNVALMKLRSKGLCRSITWIDNAWNAYSLVDAFIMPLIDHAHGCLAANVLNQFGLHWLKFLQDKAQVLC